MQPYLALCEVINRADREYTAGALAQALTDYRAAGQSLKDLQQQFPKWNDTVVEVRVMHIAQRVKELSADPPPAPASVAPATNLPAAGGLEPLPLAPGANVTNEFRALLQELRAAESDNALLLAKLKEALTAQPAATDPRELQKAEEHIRALQKENDLLRLDMEKAPKTPDAALPETQRLRKALEELDRKMHSQADAAVALLAEKNLLLDSQNRQLADLARSRKELEQRIQSGTGSNYLLLSLQTENATLKQQLAAAKSSATPGAPSSELEAKLKDQQARLTAADARVKGLIRTNNLLQEKLSTAPTVEFIAQLTAENRALKGRVDEAVAARSNAAGTGAVGRQLAQANAEIVRLQKERADLQQRLSGAPAAEALAQLRAENAGLRQQLEQATAKAGATKDAAELKHQLEQSRSEAASLQKEAGALQQRLAAAPLPATLARLTADNQKLRQQLTEAEARIATGGDTAKVTQQLATERGRLASTEAAVKNLQSENAALQRRVEQADKRAEALDVTAKASAKEADRARLLERQLAALQKQLAETDRQIADRNVQRLETRLTSLNDQMLALRSRMGIYEAKALPYTAQELALFRAPAATNLVAQSTLTRRRTSGANANLEVNAEKLMTAGDLPQAEQQLAQVVQKDDKEVRAFCNLAITQAGQGRFPDAEKSARQALALSPEDAASLGVLGHVLSAQNRRDESLDVLSRAVALRPKDAGIQTLLGIALADKGQRAEAETAFRKALQASPNHLDAHYNLAILYLTQQPPLIELARWHYLKSLSAGSAPNPELEAKLTAAAAAPPK